MTLKIFFDERQSTDKNQSLSPSAEKPKIIVDYWKEVGYPIDLAPVTPVTREKFYQIHDKKHVDDILDCKKLNGFDNAIPEVAETFYWTNGSIVSAAEQALLQKIPTMSPTSGFHHAEYNHSMGFCTFNGLALAVAELNKKYDALVGVIDIDHHYGNGTDEIASRCQLNLKHYTFGRDQTNYTWNGGIQAQNWLKSLPEIIKEFKDCDIVIYQAGADPHINDPYGGALTSKQMRERDNIVFSELKNMEIPVAWNLAGGYQEPLQKVIDIHTATLEECIRIFEL